MYIRKLEGELNKEEFAKEEFEEIYERDFNTTYTLRLAVDRSAPKKSF